MRISNIIEGVCPTCETPLERRDDYGWCEECAMGYSIGDGHFAVHLVPRSLPFMLNPKGR